MNASTVASYSSGTVKSTQQLRTVLAS